jgi:hypothetical protein
VGQPSYKISKRRDLTTVTLNGAHLVFQDAASLQNKKAFF